MAATGAIYPYQTYVRMRRAPNVWLPWMAAKSAHKAHKDEEAARETPGCIDVKIVYCETHYLGQHPKEEA